MVDRIDEATQGSTTTLTVAGVLELLQGDKLEAAARRLLPEVDRVVIDLSGVTFMDSSGLGALIAISQAAEERGTSLVLRSPPPAVTRIMEMTATESVFTIQPTEDVPLTS